MKSSLNIRLSFLMFLQFFIWSAWYVSAGTYLLQTLHFSGKQVGLIYGTFAISALFSPFISGLLADRFFSSEKLLAFFHLIGGGLLLLLSVLPGFSGFYWVTLLYTMVYVPTTALSSSLTFHHIKERTKDFAWIRAWGTVAWVLAGFLVSFLKWETSHQALQLAGIVSLISGVYCFSLPKTPPTQNKRNSLKDILSSEAGDLIRNRAFIIFLIGITLIRIPSSFYYSFVNPYLFEKGIANPAGMMAMGQVTEIALMLTLPFALYKFGLKPLLVLGMVMWGIRYILFAYGNGEESIWMIYVAILVHGITYNYTSLVGQIYVDDTVPFHLRATAQGFIVFITMGLGPLVGAYFAGAVVDHYTFPDKSHDWQHIFWYPAAVGLLTTVWFVWAFRPKKDALQ